MSKNILFLRWFLIVLFVGSSFIWLNNASNASVRDFIVVDSLNSTSFSGLQDGDEIKEVDGEIHNNAQLLAFILEKRTLKKVNIKVERNEEIITSEVVFPDDYRGMDDTRISFSQQREARLGFLTLSYISASALYLIVAVLVWKNTLIGYIISSIVLLGECVLFFIFLANDLSVKNFSIFITLLLFLSLSTLLTVSARKNHGKKRLVT